MKKDSGTAYARVPNSSKPVQPVALLRLIVFTPISPREKDERDFQIDASEELSSLDVARQEGYTNFKIQGAKLGTSTDFRRWIGIISAFSKYGYESEKITLPFSEFARMCGLKPTDINGRDRTRLSDSRFNLSSVTLSFRSKNGKRSLIIHLVRRAVLDMDADVVEIVGDESLWELYRYDHKALLGLNNLNSHEKKLHNPSTFTLKACPLELFTFQRSFRDRLAMESQIKDQNATIRRAMGDLSRIGYIDYKKKEDKSCLLLLTARLS